MQRCVNNLDCTSLSNSLDSSGYNAEQFFPSCDHSKHSSANRPLSLIVPGLYVQQVAVVEKSNERIIIA